MSADEQRPVVSGLLALVGVALAVGLVTGLAVLAGAHVLGLGGGHAAVAGDPGATMYLPKPQKTKAADGPSITLGLLVDLGHEQLARARASTSPRSGSPSRPARPPWRRWVGST